MSKIFLGEFIPFKDKKTGARIIQLTSFPTINVHPYFHCNSFTPDSETLIFYSLSEVRRSSGFDVFRVNINGKGLIQLTEGGKAGRAVLSNNGKFVYYYFKGELRQVNMENSKDEKVAFIPQVVDCESGSMNIGSISMSIKDDQIILGGQLEDGTYGILSYHTDGSEAGMLYKSCCEMNHVQLDLVDSKDIIFWTPEAKGKPYNILHMKADGSSAPRVLYRDEFNGVPSAGHFMWLGKNKEVISNLLPAHWAIIRRKLDGSRPQVIAEEVHFWHAASSLDGKWIVSDTVGPDIGLQLINVKTGRFATICHSNSSNAYPHWTHPHPAFSPDGKMVVYNSDRTGLPQVYLVKIPEKLFEELAD